MKKVILAAAFSLATLSAAHAAPVSGWELPTPYSYSNGSWSFGEVFTVSGSAMLLTALGAYDADGNGFVTSGGIKVGLFRESDHTLLASSNVLSSDQLIGHYRYSDISDVVLAANTQYRVVAVSGNDLYNVSTDLGATPAGITWNRYGYCNTTSLTSCDYWTGTEIHWMANMLVDAVPPSNVPEPASLALAGLGLAGLGWTRRRKAVKSA